MDRTVQQGVLRYMRERICTDSNPRRFGKQLGGDKQGLWRYRVGAYRVICRIEDDRMIVLVVRVGNRQRVYGKGK